MVRLSLKPYTLSAPGCSRHGPSNRVALRARPRLAIGVRAQLRSELLELLPHTFGPQPARRWQKARLKAPRLPTALARALPRKLRARTCGWQDACTQRRCCAWPGAARRNSAPHRRCAPPHARRRACALHTDLESGLLFLPPLAVRLGRARRCDCAQDLYIMCVQPPPPPPSQPPPPQPSPLPSPPLSQPP